MILYYRVGVSIQIEVASRFSPLSLGVVSGCAPLKNLEISRPISVISSMLGTELSTEKSGFFTKENVTFV